MDSRLISIWTSIFRRQTTRNTETISTGVYRKVYERVCARSYLYDICVYTCAYLYVDNVLSVYVT